MDLHLRHYVAMLCLKAPRCRIWCILTTKEGHSSQTSCTRDVRETGKLQQPVFHLKHFAGNNYWDGHFSPYDIIGGWGTSNLLRQNDSKDFFQVQSNVALHLLQASRAGVQTFCDPVVLPLIFPRPKHRVVLCKDDSSETEGSCRGSTLCALFTKSTPPKSKISSTHEE